MGCHFDFVCPECGYHVEVSGGDDCGFIVRTRTVVCEECKRIVDVVTSKTPWDDNSVAADGALECPACKGPVHAWHDNMCPRCGCRMNSGGPVVLWD